MKVRGEPTLRAEGGEVIDRRRADDRGSVTFASGIEPVSATRWKSALAASGR